MNGRIQGLDGLRAFSIGLVLLHHISRIGYDFDSLLWRLNPGPSGVTIFFVISGFLITHLLLIEERVHGTISLTGFYRRRAARILPAYLTFVLVMFLVSQGGPHPLSASDLWPALTFTANYAVPQWTLGHTWSLSVEEQFYILWPSVFLAMRGRTPLLLGLTLIALGAGVRGLEAHCGCWPTPWRFAFESHAGGLAAGCMASYALQSRRAWLEGHSTGLLVATLILASLFVWRPWPWLAPSLLAIGTAIGLLYVAVTPRGMLTRALSWRPLAWLGTLSYSIYLWQQPFLDARMPLPTWAIVAGIATTSLLSHYLVERPILRWANRRRYETNPAATVT